jgi:hypothetical protein
MMLTKEQNLRVNKVRQLQTLNLLPERHSQKVIENLAESNSNPSPTSLRTSLTQALTSRLTLS